MVGGARVCVCVCVEMGLVVVVRLGARVGREKNGRTGGRMGSTLDSGRARMSHLPQGSHFLTHRRF